MDDRTMSLPVYPRFIGDLPRVESATLHVHDGDTAYTTSDFYNRVTSKHTCPYEIQHAVGFEEIGPEHKTSLYDGHIATMYKACAPGACVAYGPDKTSVREAIAHAALTDRSAVIIYYPTKGHTGKGYIQIKRLDPREVRGSLLSPRVN